MMARQFTQKLDAGFVKVGSARGQVFVVVKDSEDGAVLFNLGGAAAHEILQRAEMQQQRDAQPLDADAGISLAVTPGGSSVVISSERLELEFSRADIQQIQRGIRYVTGE